MSQFDEDLRRAAAPMAEEPLSPDILDPRLDVPSGASRWAGVVAMASGVIAIVAVGIGIGQFAANPAASIDPAASGGASARGTASGPLTATVEESGIRLTLTLDREATAFGERVWAEATVENVGQDTVTWQHAGGCQWPGEIRVSANTPATLDLGRDDWPGDLGVLKHALTPEPISSYQHRGFTPEERVDTGIEGCWAGLPAPVEFPAGTSLTHRAAWDTGDYLGMPPVPGSYTVEFTFGFTPGAQYEPTGERQVVSIALPLLVAGDHVDWVSGEQAIDALLSDESFTDHLATHAPLHRWTSHDIAFDDERWIVTLNVGTTAADPDPRVTLVGVVDARTGVVLDVRLETSASPEG